MPLSSVYCPVFGLCTTLHFIPFHCSNAGRLVMPPAAHMLLAETAVTAFRKVIFALLCTTLHFEPSQCSTKPLFPSIKVPTAQISVLETTEIPSRVPGLGSGTLLQAVPSQCSISEVPTAQTSLLETAATAAR